MLTKYTDLDKLAKVLSESRAEIISLSHKMIVLRAADSVFSHAFLSLVANNGLTIGELNAAVVDGNKDRYMNIK